MAVSVLGPLRVDGSDDALGPRDRVVLAALTVRAGEVVGGEQLADALWGQDPPPSWNKVVQGCVVRVRKALGADAVVTQHGGYRFALPPDAVDAQRFERLVGRSRELLAVGEPERAAVLLDDALSLWRGAALPELQSWDDGRIEAQRLAELRLQAEEAHLDASLRAGRHRDVVALARSRAHAEPTRERRWALLALALYRTGQQTDALRTIAEARARLAAEVGLEPGPELVALERAILRQDPALEPPTAIGAESAVCPWPGLVPYGVDDAELYFGRDEDVGACLARLDATGVLVIVGPSGTGKSSLARAGVGAALARRGQRVVVVTPVGSTPCDALTALPSSGSPCVLVVDQCEQLVASDASARRGFFAALVAHAEHAPLVVTLRADRMDLLAAHEPFSRLAERGLFLLGPMGEEALRRAVEGPARHAGLLLEAGLVDVVVADVVDEPGALPLMSHALRETWTRREGRTLTVAAYRATGGITGAVARTAEAVYDEVGPEQRTRLRDLLLRLVGTGSAGDPTPTGIPRSHLVAEPAYESLVERLVLARLLTSDEGTVELAHEAIARAWPRLQAWLEDDRAGARLLHHLTATATGWDAMGRPESELYRGARLVAAVEWRERARPELTGVERDFLDASQHAEEARLHEAEARVRREHRSVRRLRRLVVAVAALAAVALTASLVATRQRDRADDEARVAEARRVAADALVATPHDRALLLGVEAVRLWDSPETLGSLLSTIERSPLIAGIIRTEGRPLDLAVSPDGRLAVVLDVQDVLTLHDLERREVVATLRRDDTSFSGPTFSPDGSTIAVSAHSTSCQYGGPCPYAAVEVLDTTGLRPTGAAYGGMAAPATAIAYSPDGERIAAVAAFPAPSPQDNVAVWQVGRTDRPEAVLSLDDLGVDLRATPDHDPRAWVSFSSDGEHLRVSGAGPIVTFDLRSGEVVRSVDGIGTLAATPDGGTLAVASPDGTVAVVDADSGAVRADLAGHDGLVTAAAFSGDGEVLATASSDERVIVWDARSGDRLQVLEGHAGSVNRVAFGPDDARLYTVGADRLLITWDVGRSSGIARWITGPTLDLPGEAFVLVSPSGDRVVVGDVDDIVVVDLTSGRATPLPIEGPVPIVWTAYSPDGRTLATVALDGAVALWDVRRGRPLAAAPGRGSENIGAIAFTTEGDGIVVADADGRVHELDATTLEPTGRTITVDVEPVGVRTAPGGIVAVVEWSGADAGTDLVIADLADQRVLRTIHLDSPLPRTNFSEDGTRIAAGGYDGRLTIVDTSTGRSVGPADPLHAGPVAWVTFSPDGTTLVSVGFDGQIVLSDAATGEPRARFQPGPTNLQATARFHPDGHTLLLAYKDGSAIAYETDPDAWVQHACRVAGRELTEDEWRDMFDDRPRRPTCRTG